MEITHLGSGSRGNSTLLRSGGTLVLVDCGFSLRQMEVRLGLAGVEPALIDAIFVTHHHSDHSRSALQAAKKWDSALHANLQTATKMGWEPVSECRTFGDLDRISVSDELSLLPIPVPHEGAANVAVIATNGDGRRAGIVTDLGEPTVELKKHLSGCSHVSVEANHDLQRLMNGPYPDSLKRRISGRGGHLSNSQTAEMLTEILHPGMDSIVLCHLSEKNNAPHLAESEVLLHIDERFSGDLSISKQDGPEFSHWLGQVEPEGVGKAA